MKELKEKYTREEAFNYSVDEASFTKRMNEKFKNFTPVIKNETKIFVKPTQQVKIMNEKYNMTDGRHKIKEAYGLEFHREIWKRQNYTVMTHVIDEIRKIIPEAQKMTITKYFKGLKAYLKDVNTTECPELSKKLIDQVAMESLPLIEEQRPSTEMRERKNLTEEEKSFIRSNYRTMSAFDIASKIGRNVNSVYNLINREGLKTRHDSGLKKFNPVTMDVQLKRKVLENYSRPINQIVEICKGKLTQEQVEEVLIFYQLEQIKEKAKYQEPEKISALVEYEQDGNNLAYRVDFKTKDILEIKNAMKLLRPLIISLNPKVKNIELNEVMTTDSYQLT